MPYLPRAAEINPGVRQSSFHTPCTSLSRTNLEIRRSLCAGAAEQAHAHTCSGCPGLLKFLCATGSLYRIVQSSFFLAALHSVRGIAWVWWLGLNSCPNCERQLVKGQ